MKLPQYYWVPSSFALLAFFSLLAAFFSAYQAYDLSKQPEPNLAGHVTEALVSGGVAAGGAFGLQPEVTVPAGADSLKATVQAFMAYSEREELHARISAWKWRTFWSIVSFVFFVGAAKLTLSFITEVLLPSRPNSNCED